MENSKNFIQEEIINKFHLFKGRRTQEEDEKIFRKVNLLCFEEILNFLNEIISDDYKNKILEEIENDFNVEKLINIFQTIFNDEIILWQLKIRISKFLDYLLIQILLKKNEGKFRA